LPWEDPLHARAALAELLTWAEGAAERLGAYALRIEPRIIEPLPNVLRGWVRAPIDLYPYQTQLVDLRQGADALLAHMKPKCRYNIRVSQRHGVEVTSTGDLAGLPTFFDLFRATALRQDFFAEPYGFFLNLASEHCPDGAVRFYTAWWHDSILATALVLFFGGTATFLYGGSAEQHRETMAPYALQWAIITDAMNRGMDCYDFYGCEPFGLSDHPYAGFSRFKRQFGGQLVQYAGAHEWIFYDRLADAVVTALQPDRQRSN
jgi:lipid II:glycine glycyltransferase (peptidoglycan interpeptide bridge formation enzyme)